MQDEAHWRPGDRKTTYWLCCGVWEVGPLEAPAVIWKPGPVSSYFRTLTGAVLGWEERWSHLTPSSAFRQSRHSAAFHSVHTLEGFSPVLRHGWCLVSSGMVPCRFHIHASVVVLDLLTRRNIQKLLSFIFLYNLAAKQTSVPCIYIESLSRSLKEQRLRYLKQQERRQQQTVSESEKLQRLKDRVESQEAKLKKIRAMRGQVDYSKVINGNLCTYTRSIYTIWSL